MTGPKFDHETPCRTANEIVLNTGIERYYV